MNNWQEERLRSRLSGRLRQHIAGRRLSPRLVLSSILCVTAVSGFMASMGMLKLGLAQMWLRYPLAVLVAWGVFLVLVRQWANHERDAIHLDEELAGLSDFSPANLAQEKLVESNRMPRTQAPRSSSWWHILLNSLSPGDLMNADMDAEGCLAVLVIAALFALLVGAVIAIGGLIVEAESVLAEVLLDTVLVTALYQRLRKKQPDWMEGALRQTVWPVVATAALLMVAGFFMHRYAPEARSIGGVWRHWRAQ